LQKYNTLVIKSGLRGSAQATESEVYSDSQLRLKRSDTADASLSFLNLCDLLQDQDIALVV